MKRLRRPANLTIRNPTFSSLQIQSPVANIRKAKVHMATATQEQNVEEKRGMRKLEVERKFVVTDDLLRFLRQGKQDASSNVNKQVDTDIDTAKNTDATSPTSPTLSPFTTISPLGTTHLHDLYYDHTNTLFPRGIYIRQRNGLWDAKLRVGGDTINSAFREVSGDAAIREVLSEELHVRIDGVRLEDALDVRVELGTWRESWEVDGRFRVDVNWTVFGESGEKHVVGEVELVEVVEEMEEEGARERLDGEIERFMKRYPEAFPEGKVEGKLTAFFEWKRRHGAGEGEEEQVLG